MKMNEADNYTGQHVLVFGDPKTGKTTIVSKLAEKHKLIWFSTDGGHSVLHKLSQAAKDNIELVILPDVRDYPIAIDIARKFFKGQDLNLCYAHGGHDCKHCTTAKQPFTVIKQANITPDTIIVWDHLSQVSDSCLSLICKNKPVDYKLQIDDWGSLRFHMLELMMNIQVSRHNIVAIAHAIEADTEDNKKKIMPQIGSSEFARTVAKHFDHIIYTSVMNKEHRFGSSTTYQINVVTGSRTDIEIEKLEKGKETLEPFFDGTIKKPLPQAAESTQKLLEEKVTEKSKGQSELAKALATVMKPEFGKEHSEPVVPETTSTPQEFNSLAEIDKSNLSIAEKAKAKLALMKKVK